MSLQGASLRQIVETKSAIGPREMGPNNWKFRPTSYGPGYQATFFPINYQSQNWTHSIDPTSFSHAHIRGHLTGQEPVYGVEQFRYEPLNQNQTNVRSMNLTAKTQMQPWNGYKQIDTKLKQTPANPFWYRNYAGSTTDRVTSMTRG